MPRRLSYRKNKKGAKFDDINIKEQTERLKKRKSSMRSYHNNKAKIARQKILNRIDDNGCVSHKVMEDKEKYYNWTEEELAMMRKCLGERRSRYHIDQELIDNVLDKRYRHPYPFNDNLYHDVTSQLLPYHSSHYDMFSIKENQFIRDSLYHSIITLSLIHI